MPANKKMDTIPQRNGATSNGVLPTHQPLLEDFHQYVRSEIRHATRMVMEEIMCEELSSLSSSQMGRMYP